MAKGLFCPGLAAFAAAVLLAPSLRGGAPVFMSATVVDVAEVFDVAVDANSDVVTLRPATVSAAAEPSDLPAPLFHFDATRTNDWTFNSARTQVTKIPSLVGSRYLASSLGDGDAGQLGNGSINPPLWMASVEELGGLPAIDLGAANSCRALFFDPIENNGSIDTTFTKVNLLVGIGTVVAVHRPLPTSAMPLFGGGYLKGSPWGATDTTCYKNNWRRDSSSDYSGFIASYWFPVFYGYRGPMAKSHMWHDGVKTDPTIAGYTGGWEISIFQPTNAIHQAAGLGTAEIPSMAYARGGSQWAELYVFGQLVSEDVLGRLNAYLAAKWFSGRKTLGYNGYSSVGRVRVYKDSWTVNGATNAASVAAGETLKVDRLNGGRGVGARFEKDGAGTLKILDAAHFGGDIVLKGGALDVSTRPVPSLAELPQGLSYRFDASDVDSMTLEEESGVEYVRRWANKTQNTVKSGTAVYARAAGDNAAKRPWLVRNALGQGLHTIDFGKYNTANTTDDSRYFDVVHSSDGSAFTAFSIPSVYTVVAVVGAQRSGGNIVCSSKKNAGVFARHQSNVDWITDADFAKPLLRTAAVTPGYASVYPITNSCVMIDGAVRDSQKGYESPGFQVVGVRASAEGVRYIGGTGTRNGGLNLCELLLWQRPLSETEIRDAQAYLTKKWFGRDLAGYRSPGHVLPEARTIVAEGDCEINVPAGQTNRVEGVTANARLRKTGAGTLEVGPFGSAGTGAIVVEDGSVRPVAALDVAADASAPAEGASMHLDSADEASVYLKPGTETGEVWCWYDKRHRNAAYMMTAGRNPIRSSAGATLNGTPVVDCQPDETKRGMLFARGLDGVRAAFVVWQPMPTGTILGSHSTRDFNGKSIDYTRHSNGNALIIDNQGAYPIRNGKIYADGSLVTVSATSLDPGGDFQLTELYPSGATHVSALACDRGTLSGNARYAEVILYERELSEREKVATRNYLTAKWFPDRQLQQLPEAEAAALPGSLTYASGARFPVEIAADGSSNIVSVVGTLSFEPGVVVDITGLAGVADPKAAWTAIASAGAYSGLDNLATAAVVADGAALTGSSLPMFKVDASGTLLMKFGSRGFLIEFR